MDSRKGKDREWNEKKGKKKLLSLGNKTSEALNKTTILGSRTDQDSRGDSQILFNVTETSFLKSLSWSICRTLTENSCFVLLIKQKEQPL